MLLPVAVAVGVAGVPVGGSAGHQPVREVLKELLHRTKKTRKTHKLYHQDPVDYRYVPGRSIQCCGPGFSFRYGFDLSV